MSAFLSSAAPRQFIRRLQRESRWAWLLLLLAALSYLASAMEWADLFLPASVLLLLGAWLHIRRLPLKDGPLLPLLVFGQFFFLISGHFNDISPDLLHWQALTGFFSLFYAALCLELLINELREHRPLKRGRGEKALFILAALLALAGIFMGSALFVMPILIRPVMRWLRHRDLRRTLPWFFLLLLPMILVSMMVGFFQGLEAGTTQTEFTIGNLPDNSQVNYLRSIKVLASAWLTLQLPATLMILIGRLLKQSRIRTKLTMNAIFAGVLPLLLVSFLILSMAVVVLGTYRAKLVSSQVQERLESGRLVTAWFAQAYADPLDREGQRRFEQQINSLGEESHVSRGFFSLYLSRGIHNEHEPDSLREERWTRLVSSWRMPGDFPLRELNLPVTWRSGPQTGVIRVGARAYQLALVEQEELLAVGLFPLDPESLDRIGTSIGTGLRVVSISTDDLQRFGMNQIGLSLPCEEIELGRTADFPGPRDAFSRRIFRIGVAHLDSPDFPLSSGEEHILVQVEALPGRMMTAFSSEEKTLVFPYMFLVVIQFFLLLPLLFFGVWIAWMINWRISRSTSELRKGTEELARGNLDLRIPEQTGDELGLLARSFNDMSARIRANMRELATKERMERELSIARGIQQGLLPDHPPEVEGIEICASCQMALEVGGDYYDFKHPESEDFSLAVGDVSGKGVAAALLMSNLQAAWRSLLDVEMDPSLVNKRLNEQLAGNTADELFVTFVHGQFLRRKKSLRFSYSNAGHNPPLLVRDGRCSTLDKGGLALGMFAGVNYERDEIQLHPGDSLVFYTDGLTEAQNHEEEEFGQDRLTNLLEKSNGRNAKEMHEDVQGAVRRFEQGAPRTDDLTLVIMQVKDYKTDVPG